MAFDTILNLIVTKIIRKEKLKDFKIAIHTRHCCDNVCIQCSFIGSIQQPDMASNLVCFSYRILTSSCVRMHGVYFAPNRIKSAGCGPNHGFTVISSSDFLNIEEFF